MNKIGFSCYWNLFVSLFCKCGCGISWSLVDFFNVIKIKSSHLAAVLTPDLYRVSTNDCIYLIKFFSYFWYDSEKVIEAKVGANEAGFIIEASFWLLSRERFHHETECIIFLVEIELSS